MRLGINQSQLEVRSYKDMQLVVNKIHQHPPVYHFELENVKRISLRSTCPQDMSLDSYTVWLKVKKNKKKKDYTNCTFIIALSKGNCVFRLYVLCSMSIFKMNSAKAATSKWPSSRSFYKLWKTNKLLRHTNIGLLKQSMSLSNNRS